MPVPILKCVCVCVCLRGSTYDETCTKFDGFYVCMCPGTPLPLPHLCVFVAKHV